MEFKNLPLRKLSNFHEGQLLLVDKPLTWTSFDVVNKIRYHLKKIHKTGNIKVGHAGTLDPLATGLLIVCIGKYTKRIDEVQALSKEYEGSMIIGATTPSFDKETEIDKTYETKHITINELTKTTRNFIGEIDQKPPQFSAIKVNGVRAYKKARKNETTNIKSKQVLISDFDLINIELPKIKFRISCSKGTYIRSLVNDFGVKLNSGAYLNSLRRTKIGNFHLKNAMKLEELLKI